MMIVTTLLVLVSVVGYFIHVGGKLKEAKLSDEAMRDIQKTYKMESAEDRALQKNLDGDSTDPHSIGSLFPDELRFFDKESRGSEDIHSPVTPKD